MCDHSGEVLESEMPSVADPMAEAARHVARLSHEARAAQSRVEDTIEDGVHAARRAVKSVRRGIERLEDERDEAIRSVKRRPLRAIAAALGAGLMLGLVASSPEGAAWLVASRTGGRRVRSTRPAGSPAGSAPTGRAMSDCQPQKKEVEP